MRERRILTTLPMTHRDVMRGPSDKLKIHAFMGNHQWLIRQIGWYVRLHWKIMELGAGDGYLSLQFAKKGFCSDSDLHGLDLLERPLAWPDEASWAQGDIFTQPLPQAQVLVANFFLHHFPSDQLRELGKMIPAETQIILVVEPARSPLAVILAQCWGFAQLNRVMRNDLQTSFRAGFRGRELPHLLGLGNEWQIVVQQSVLGSYRMMAMRVGDTVVDR